MRLFEIECAPGALRSVASEISDILMACAEGISNNELLSIIQRPSLEIQIEIIPLQREQISSYVEKSIEQSFSSENLEVIHPITIFPRECITAVMIEWDGIIRILMATDQIALLEKIKSAPVAAIDEQIISTDIVDIYVEYRLSNRM